MRSSERTSAASVTSRTALLMVLTGLAWAALAAQAPPRVTAAPGSEAFSACDSLEDFDSANFPANPTIDNQWLPLAPGTEIVLEGVADRGGGPTEHRVIFTVTDVTKVVNGVRTVVVWDRDISGGVLVEEELAFFAQDRAGNVWNLGEYPEEIADGVRTAPNTWLAGIDGAVGGIHMVADPHHAGGWYLQGWSPSIDFLDCANIHREGQSVSVPAGDFEDVLVILERGPLAREGGLQLKYHAPGKGIVQIGAVGDKEGETLMLAEYNALDASGLAAARARALVLDANLRALHPFKDTAPAQ